MNNKSTDYLKLLTQNDIGPSTTLNSSLSPQHYIHRPNIFRYQDLSHFLQDYLNYIQSSRPTYISKNEHLNLSEEKLLKIFMRMPFNKKVDLALKIIDLYKDIFEFDLNETRYLKKLMRNCISFKKTTRKNLEC